MMNSTLQTIWNCLDIPNKETVDFVNFRIDYNRMTCRLYQDKENGKITIEGAVEELILQKILKHLPTAFVFHVRRYGKPCRYCEYQWNEETQKMQILPEWDW